MRLTSVLGELCDGFVFVGGGVVDIILSDSESPPARPTIDIDVIANVDDLADYYKLCDRLKERGFSEDIEGRVICRWKYADLIVDVMPASEGILGFGNR